MPADGTRAAIKNRGLRHHPDGSSSKNYSVSEGRTGDLSIFKKYFYGAPRSMKMGTIVSLWHYDGAASPRAPIDKSAMACDLALRLMLGSVPDFARSSDYPATGALSIDSAIDAMGQKRRFGSRPVTSGLPLSTDILGCRRHVSKVPLADSCTAAKRNAIRSPRRRAVNSRKEASRRVALPTTYPAE
jgi:hypothetical protein